MFWGKNLFQQIWELQTTSGWKTYEYINVASLWRILTMRRSIRSKSVIPRCAGTAGRCLSCDGTWYSWLTGSHVQTWFQEGAVGSQKVSIIHAYILEHVALHHSKTAYANHSTNCMELPAHRRSCTREAQRQNCLLPGKTNAKDVPHPLHDIKTWGTTCFPLQSEHQNNQEIHSRV